LRINAPSKDLSSGETMQFSSSLLGANSPSQINWSATTGTISASGFYQAPAVTAESVDHVTGCVQGTNSCNTVVLRILPLRITPDAPIVSLGNSIQLNADVGGSSQTAQWSVLAGGGAIANGLYTAPSSATGAGPVAVSASVGSATEQSGLSVTGAFPGLVNRLYEYLDGYDPTPNTEGFVTDAVTAYGNRAYAVDFGGPANRALAPSYSALDVYDITNPTQPVWISAVESVSTNPIHVFTYGNNLFEVDSGIGAPAPSRIVTYSLQGGQAVLSQITNLPDLAITTVNNGIVHGLPESPDGVYSTTFPVYLCDVSSGTPLITQYTLPVPTGNPPLQFFGISGIGNTVYVSWTNPAPSTGLTLATYDISTSPPSLVSSIQTQFGFELQVVNSSLLFADAQVYDISGATPVPVTTIPMLKTLSVQGNSVVALGFFQNYFVIDVSNSSNPVITRNVADLLTGYPAAVLAGNDLLTSEGFGGMAVYDVSTPGGPAAWSVAGSLGGSFDQVLQQTTMYIAGETPLGGGGLDIIDLSGANPTELGSLYYYPNNPPVNDYPAFAVQVSGTNVFLGFTDCLRTINVSDPSAPVETASTPIPTNALALSGTTLFVGTGDSRLVVLDVSNPNAPQQLASLALPGSPNTVRISGTELFVADVSYGLLIFDVSNPAAPVLLSQTVFNTPVWDTAINGTTAFLAADATGLVLLDISNPMKVQQLSQTAMPLLEQYTEIDQAYSVSIQNEFAYVGTLSGLVLAYDFNNPAYPRLLALNDVGCCMLPAVYALGNNLYITDGIEIQMDNSAPFNSIQLFYPPSAFINPTPFSIAEGGGASAVAALGNSKRLWKRWALTSRLLGPQRHALSISDCIAKAKSPGNNFWQRLAFTDACRRVVSLMGAASLVPARQ
jgi:hypothetical protein